METLLTCNFLEYCDSVPLEYIKGDCANLEDVEKAIQGVTVVFHLASEKYCFNMFEDKQKQWRNNYEGKGRMKNYQC